jgi:hypothetical protein
MLSILFMVLLNQTFFLKKKNLYRWVLVAIGPNFIGSYWEVGPTAVGKLAYYHWVWRQSHIQ